MDSSALPNTDPNSPPRPRRRRGQMALRLTLPGLFLLLLLNGIGCSTIAWLVFQYRADLQGLVVPVPSATLTSTSSPSPTATETSTPTLTPSPTPTSTQSPTLAAGRAVTRPLILSLQDQANFHLFAYQPLSTNQDPGLPLTRVSTGPWDDLHPSISPDGIQVAFSSNRSGYWDIYLLNLQSGKVDRLTDSLEYDDNPAWSPDGKWVVFETYLDGSLEIVIRSADDPASPVIRLTNNSAADYHPVWSPQGREVAFISTRSGKAEVYTSDLNQVDEKTFKQISDNPNAAPQRPAWSLDGAQLSWSELQDGSQHIKVVTLSQPEGQPANLPVDVGSGDFPTWGENGASLYAVLHTPNLDYLVRYDLTRPGVMTPPLPLGSAIQGMTWNTQLAFDLPLNSYLRQSADVTPSPIYQALLENGTPIPGGRFSLARVDDLQAPYAMLQDRVDESFIAMRTDLAQKIGWDYLASLENAYVPLTEPLPPGMGDSWLYSGRAIAINTQLLNAGWMIVLREDFGAETYWRILLRPRYQDGSVGAPLNAKPWDFFARFEGEPEAYENGGKLGADISAGYWFDFTAFARKYGWQRLPALPTWVSAYSQARFNEFVLTDSLDWRQAMLEIYPPEIFITPSPILPPTQTPTPTSRWYQSPTPSATPTPRPTLTSLPTSTPVPPTATVTWTPKPTSTKSATSKPTTTRTPSPTPTPSRTAAPTVTPTRTGTP